jgi:hypothetical protein
MRKRDRICNQGLVYRDGGVEKELDFTSITDVASPASPSISPDCQAPNFLFSSFVNASTSSHRSEI